jgi:hypothetical protein
VTAVVVACEGLRRLEDDAEAPGMGLSGRFLEDMATPELKVGEIAGLGGEDMIFAMMVH